MKPVAANNPKTQEPFPGVSGFTKSSVTCLSGKTFKFESLTSGGIKPEGAELRFFHSENHAWENFFKHFESYEQAVAAGQALCWRREPEVVYFDGRYSIYSRCLLLPAGEIPVEEDPATLRTGPSRGERGWRATKGPMAANTSGFRATGHRLLLVSDSIEETTAGGIVLAKATLDKERSSNVYATVIEIGHDCWSDKSTDFCAVGDRVLIGQYTGKFEVSKRDGKEYRFVTDLDIISTVED